MLGTALLLSSSTAAGEFSCVAKGAVCAPSDPPFCCPGLGCYNGGGFGYGEGGGEEVEEEERERRRKKEIEEDRGCRPTRVGLRLIQLKPALRSRPLSEISRAK